MCRTIISGLLPQSTAAGPGLLGTGVICGVRVEEIENPIMRDIRYLDQLTNELAKGKAMEKIFRES